MYLFGVDSVVENWAGVIRFRYRWPIIRDALTYLVQAFRGFHIAGLRKECTTLELLDCLSKLDVEHPPEA